MLGLELGVALRGIGRHAEDRGAGFGEGRRLAVEVAGLRGAPGGVVLGIEIEDERLAGEGGERQRRTGMVGKGKAGRRGARDELVNHIAFLST